MEFEMDLEKLEEMWQKDLPIDKTDLVTESLVHGYELWQKYKKMYHRENARLHKLKADQKILKLNKYEHYTQGGSAEAAKQGWKLPPIGKVLKTDVDRYMEADEQLIEMNLKVAYQTEVVDYLRDIINLINNRQWGVKAAQWQMNYEAGGKI